MFKRIGILSLLLGAGALIQPVSAFAAERHAAEVGHENTRVVAQYRAPVRQDVQNRGREDWDRGRIEVRNVRPVVPATPYYYEPLPAPCNYGR